MVGDVADPLAVAGDGGFAATILRRGAVIVEVEFSWATSARRRRTTTTTRVTRGVRRLGRIGEGDIGICSTWGRSRLTAIVVRSTAVFIVTVTVGVGATTVIIVAVTIREWATTRIFTTRRGRWLAGPLGLIIARRC
jgi:hypothetical protein